MLLKRMMTSIENNPTKAERIADRRRRAEAKREREKEESEGKHSVSQDVEKGEDNAGQRQVQASLQMLEQLKQSNWENIAEIRLKDGEAEHARRCLEEVAWKQRQEALCSEALSNSRKSGAIEMRWPELQTMKCPLQLATALEKQITACEILTNVKDRRIREFKTELKIRDEDYIKCLRQQHDNLQKVLLMMREQCHSQKKNSEEQLDEIEKAFMNERKKLLNEGTSKIEELLDRRIKMDESEIIEERHKREAKFLEQIEQLRMQAANDYSTTKINLEKNIQELEKHFQSMQATNQLNQEKLDYNLQILTERSKEHSVVLKTSKNKQENVELTIDYKRLTTKFKDLQDIYKHFVLTHTKKFREIWKLNEEEMEELKTEILKADKIIHEQQLGLEWSPPQDDEFNFENDTFSEAGTTVKSSGKISDDSISLRQKYSDAKIQKVLDLIVTECHFLLDHKVKDQLAELPQEQQLAMQTDGILKYVGAESQADVNLLVSLFYQGQDEDDETLYVEGDDVLKLVTDFTEEKENLRIADVTSQLKKPSRQVGPQSEVERQNRRRREQRKFWEKKSLVVPEMNVRIWKVLNHFLQKYYIELQDRAQLLDETAELQKQNFELKLLVDHGLRSKVNDELHVPPAHTIKLVTYAPTTNTTTEFNPDIKKKNDEKEQTV